MFLLRENLTVGITALLGNILSFRVFGRVIVVLNSVKTSKDLLERRADIYSGRPVIPSAEMYVFSSQVFTT
jgi:hypothetical protein